jgi:excisionase family DNA binding protein
MSKMLTVSEFAERNNVSMRYVQRLVSDGRIAGAEKRHARLVLIPESAVMPEKNKRGRKASEK